MENMNFIECNWNKFVVQTMKIILEKEQFKSFHARFLISAITEWAVPTVLERN